MARRHDPEAQQDLEEYRRNTERARAGRRGAAAKVGEYVGAQVEQLIIGGDVMGGRAAVSMRVRAVAAAERSGDREALRAAAMDLAAASGAWVAALDLELHRTPA